MKKYFWPLAFLGLFLLRSLLPAEKVEIWYSRGAYPLLHKMISSCASLSPVPAIYLLVVLLIVFLFFRIRHWWGRSLSMGRRLLSFFTGALALLSALSFFFLLLWGLNYARIPVEKKLGLQLAPLDAEELQAEYERITRLLFAERHKILALMPLANDTVALAFPDVPQSLIEASLKSVLALHNYPTDISVQLREIYPGLLLRIGTAGVYLAWSGEGHYDGGLHSIQKPFVMAHEMAHAYGFGDEGICNFWAWLACMRSENPFLRYSANLAYWRYLRNGLWQIAPDVAAELFSHLPKGIQKDLEAIHRQMQRYPDILPDFRNWLYESYLKSQGIEEGMKSYSRLPMLVKAYLNKAQSR